MIQIRLSDAECQRAWNRVKSQPDYKNSMRGNMGQYVGFLAECAFERYCRDCGYPVELVDEYNHDFIVRGKTFDLKAKLRKAPTLATHEASVWGKSLSHQKPDYFAFASVIEPWRAVELVGYLSYEDFKQKARPMRKGEDQGNMSIVDDCWNVYHSDLIPFKQPDSARR